MAKVRRSIQKALAEEQKRRGLTQSDIAREIGVHRSVIHREIQGYADMTLGRVAEIAYALGRTPAFELLERRPAGGANVRAVARSTPNVETTSKVVTISTSPIVTSTTTSSS